MVNALHKWLTSIFWKTAVASNSQIRGMVVSKSMYIVVGNDIMGYFRSAANSVNVPGTIANFSVRNFFFLDYVGNADFKPQEYY